METMLIEHVAGDEFNALLESHAMNLRPMIEQTHFIDEKALGDSNEFMRLKDLLHLSEDTNELGSAKAAFMFAAFHHLQKIEQAGSPTFDVKADAHFIRYIYNGEPGRIPPAPTMPDQSWPDISIKRRDFSTAD